MPKIEGLPGDHDFKPERLLTLSRLFHTAGNWAESKRLLVWALELQRERVGDRKVARILGALSDISLAMRSLKEGIQQMKETLETWERLGDKAQQAQRLIGLAWLLREDDQVDAAEEAAFRTLDLLPEGEQYRVCESHRLLGRIYQSKGETEKTFHHNEVALGTVSSFDWHDALFSVHYNLTELCLDEDGSDDAHAHLEHAELHTTDSTRRLGL